MPLQIFYTDITGERITVVAMNRPDAVSKLAERGYTVACPDLTPAGKEYVPKVKGPGKKSRPEGNRKG